MADKKVVFVAFAIEDVRIRDMIKGHHCLFRLRRLTWKGQVRAMLPSRWLFVVG